MTWDDIIKVILTVAPFAYAYVKKREIDTERFDSLIRVGETVWHAVEVWKSDNESQAGGPSGNQSEDEFIRRIKDVQRIGAQEEAKMRAWAKQRSTAGKYRNGVTRNPMPLPRMETPKP